MTDKIVRLKEPTKPLVEDDDRNVRLMAVQGYIMLIKKPNDNQLYGPIENSFSLDVQPNRTFFYWTSREQDIDGCTWVNRDMAYWKNLHPDWEFTIYEDPETRIKLQNMACEKIAEELKRKASNMSITQFESQMQAIINKAIAECNKNLSSKYKFPPEAKAIIEDLAKEMTTKYFKAEITRWETSINEFFAAKQAESDSLTEAKVTEIIEKLRPMIKQQAREEFIATLETARLK